MMNKFMENCESNKINPENSTVTENDKTEKPRRSNAGINTRLDTSYTWPQDFGLPKNKPLSIMSEIPEVKNDKTSAKILKENGEANEIDKANNRTRQQIMPDIPLLYTDTDVRETSSVHSVRSRRSAGSNMELQRKRHALDIAKVKQAIEMKRLENQLQLLELEQDIRETELSEENQSQVSLSSFHSDTKNIPEKVPSEIPRLIPESQIENDRKSGIADKKSSDIHQLCQSINDAIRTVAQSPRQDRYIARQVVERDFPYFDGNPEEWPTFIMQFRKISTLCEYSSEEMMIKLQKCLKGEARMAVSGMMISPENIDSVLKTLEMRFGRPDQIIDGLIAKVKAVPPIKEQNLDSLIKFSSHVTCLVATVKSLGFNEHLQNPILLRDMIQKLPDMLKLRWGEEIMKGHGKTDLGDFSLWINEIATAACYVNTPNTSKYSKPESFRQKQFSGSSRKQETTLVIADNKRTDEVCTYCTVHGHGIRECQKMKQDDVNTRWETVTKLKLCFSCLRNNHQTMKCRFKRQCGIKNCRRSHHRLLHNDSIQPIAQEPQHTTRSSENVQSTQTEDLVNENVLVTGQGAANVLLRMVNVKLYGANSVIETVALCDEASTVTLVDQSIADQLGIEERPQTLRIQWTNDLTSCYENSHSLDIPISGIHQNAKMFTMKNVRSVENLSLPLQIIKETDWKRYNYLDGIPFSEIRTRPMILIGQDNIKMTVARKIIQGPDDSPVATKTSLGWILHGGIESFNKSQKVHCFHICECGNADELLHNMVKQTFTTEAFGVQTNKKATKEDSRALAIMENTARRIGERFEIGLLWKSDHPVLPESKSVAIRRLQCVERQIQKDDNYRQRYCDKIRSYVQKGYARKLTAEEAEEEGTRCWYLPHFGVINSNKPNKLRLVFDAASKSSGVSLNDHLLSGPDLLQSLVGVLVKFRQRKIAFCSDVREMFHQVRIISQDQQAQRFLWRDGNPNKPLETYEMQVMTFGATCSPASAQFIKNLNAEQLTKRPEILNAITKKHYVDDYLDCTDTVEEALEMITEVRRIQILGGFELVNWISNSEDVKTALSLDEDIRKDMNLNPGESVQRVLGLYWDSNTDNFCFNLNFNHKKMSKSTERPTKRQILQLVMSLFDPLGLIVNLTIRGRILIQDIWKTGIGWDDSIDEELHETWTCLIKDLEEVTSLAIPRCYSTRIPDAERIELHVFCDASKKAYASAAYLRTIARENIDVTLILAKARVAPTKPISIPRLELQAALMGSRIANTLIETLEFKIHEIHLWTDSTTVLYWIKGDAGKLGQFESHRIGEIQENTNSSDWHWIPSKSNAADNATRTYSKDGSNPLNFLTWLNGPDFLYQEKSTWPTKLICNSDEMCPERQEFTALSFEKNVGLPDFTRFSKWSRLLRTTAWVTRFGRILLNKLHRLSQDLPSDLTVPELDDAKILLLKECQQESFPDELHLLRKNKAIRMDSRLKRLSPMLNEKGIIVLSGRTSLSPELEWSTKHPVILPAKHRLTDLILQNIHEKSGHHGIETVLNEVRMQYWVIDGRSAVKNIFRKCQKCRVMKAKPMTPIMGQLPVYRLTASLKPFTYTGVDYFGPLFVTVGRRREKRWGVLFTCLSIRAIHLEVAHSLTTDSAIMAVRRMIARRGQPREIYSDNGTNFRGAAEELKRALKEFDQTKINQTMTQLNITWKFLPPGSPHMAGIWERMIRTVKNTFKVILNGQVLRDELLLTFFAECENIVNSRPLTKVSVDPDDLESLTPNHFLLGNGNDTHGLGEIRDLRSHWRRSQRLADHFWKRWVKEYLPTLNKYSKWNVDNKPIQLDDVVIIVDENSPRKSWKLGKVEAVFPGPDAKIRVVDVKTANGTLRRPVNKLCRIDMEV